MNKKTLIMMKNQQEWVENITQMSVKVKDGHTKRASVAGSTARGMTHLAAILLVLLPACDRRENVDGQIPRQTLVSIYIDLLEARKGAIPTGVDSTAAANSVLASHGVTKELYQASIGAYAGRSEEWKSFYEDVLNRLEEEEQSRNKRPADSGLAPRVQVGPFSK